MKFKKNPNQKPFNDIEEGKKLKEVADNVMNIDGNIKGVAILNNIIYIKNKKGDEAVEIISKTLNEVGYPLDFKKINEYEPYKESYNVLINLIMKDVFKWNDDDIFNSGRGAAKISPILKSIIQYLLSPTLLINNANKYWQRQLDFGKINVIDCNEEDRRIIIGVEGYNKSSVSCIYQAGYFIETVGFAVKEKSNLEIEETKCVYAGDEFHEYTITW